MNERDFCYWLQGFVEINGPSGLTEEQMKIIKDHLSLVFDKQTPVSWPGIVLEAQPFVPNPIIGPETTCSSTVTIC